MTLSRMFAKLLSLAPTVTQAATQDAAEAPNPAPTARRAPQAQGAFAAPAPTPQPAAHSTGLTDAATLQPSLQAAGPLQGGAASGATGWAAASPAPGPGPSAAAPSPAPRTAQELAIDNILKLPLPVMERTAQQQEARVQAIDQQVMALSRDLEDGRHLFQAAMLRANNPQTPSPEMQTIARARLLIKRKLAQLGAQRKEAASYARVTQLLAGLIHQARLSEDIRQEAFQGWSLAKINAMAALVSSKLQQEASDRAELVSSYEAATNLYDADELELQAEMAALHREAAPTLQQHSSHELDKAESLADALAALPPQGVAARSEPSA